MRSQLTRFHSQVLVVVLLSLLRSYSNFKQPARPNTYAKALDETTALNLIIENLKSLETTFNKKVDQIQGAISKLENGYTECMDMIIENSNRMDKLTEQTTTNHRMIEQLFTFTIRQLYSNHKGLQSEQEFISLAQSFFNIQKF